MDFLTFMSVFLLLISTSCYGLSENHHGDEEGGLLVVAPAKQQKEFDYFLLALLWPGTLCQGTNHCCSANACCRSNATSMFTIHGLWVNYNDGTWPACCNNGSNFDIKKITPLLGGLQIYWPSLSCNLESTCDGGKGLFWAHEWEKHGTCATPVIWDEYTYFLTTLNIYFKYNITKILIEEGYIPSNSEKYPLGGIVSAIQNAVRATPLLVCSDGAVQELRLCFCKNFEPQDCPNNVTPEEACPRYVSLPEYVPRITGIN
ncbi:hypothetical protein AQUCO_00201286v1 [Aquilegia coerulea]|uniref:Uncharacterized protein n=2 Tax=Aquilegia coerulea TaxID=218851 RepID=A0A2G5F787_AQUCA|nr:hypothetical protein AQUCO_00201286v1 [Aquilegia coerulea]